MELQTLMERFNQITNAIQSACIALTLILAPIALAILILDAFGVFS